MEKLVDLYEEVNNECDGCQYFDMNSIYKYVEFDKPLYALVSKRRIGKLIYVSPKQYIHKIAMGFGGLSYEDALGGYYDDIGKDYAERMVKGSKAPIGYYTINSSSQEGRHRAMATMKLGVNKIPVIEFKNVNRDEFIDYVIDYKDKSFDELNELFIKNGYRGITRLGFNDLQRFIDYNEDELIKPKDVSHNQYEKNDDLDKIFKELD